VLTVQEIKEFINNDKNSEKKLQARIGERYYQGKHDIENFKVFYYDDNNMLREDKTKSNIKISHPFFTELIDQKIQYQFSGDSYIKSNIQELQDELDEYFNNNEDFKAELEEVATNSSVMGFGYLYLFRNKDGKLTFQSADTMGVVEVRAKETQDNCDYVIYWYIDRITNKNEKIKKIQVWTDKEVYFYIEKDDEGIQLDESEPINPRTHSIYKIKGMEGNYGESFGFIPFFRLDNNRKQLSDLEPIKTLIDDYDLMACGLSNNLQDLTEGYFVVKGYPGESMEELSTNLKAKKIVGVGEDGDVDVRTVTIPYEARRTKMEIDEKNIYRFGMGFNSAQVGDGNVTNIVIKSRYALLDLKCNKFETNLRRLLNKVVKVVLDEINTLNKTAYSIKDVYYEFEREVMTNATDNAMIEQTYATTRQIEVNTLLNLAASIDNETIVRNICNLMEWDYEEIKDRLPKDETDLREFENEISNLEIEGN
jgi:SPP1 family phage portal protein